MMTPVPVPVAARAMQTPRPALGQVGKSVSH